MADGLQNAQKWDPSIFFGPTKLPYAVILLNQPIPLAHRNSFSSLWSGASFRICADGGANRYHDAFSREQQKGRIALPHEIRGDLDSLRSDVKQHYEKLGVKVTKATSQYATDLQKCVLAVEAREEEESEGELWDIVIIGGLSGRLDQTMHTLHVLCQLSSTSAASNESSFRTKKIPRAGAIRGEEEEDDFVTLKRRPRAWTFSESSLAWVLSKGVHEIKVPKDQFGPTCGLLPFEVQQGEEESRGAVIKTKGLEWDMDGTPSAVGGFLSTSNHVRDESIMVEVDRPIIWTVELRPDQ